MIRTSFKRLVVIMLAIFMANFVVAAVQSNWVNHEIEHALHQVPMSVMVLSFNNVVHTNLHDDESDPDSVSVIGHQLLHAVDHLQLFPSAALIFRIPKPSGMVLHQFTPVKLPATIFEAPFRPPRLTSIAI